jgi:DnaJ-class molecular chaperone
MDLYKTLGVNRNASETEIKKAYKKQAMKHHPDKGGDSAQFQKLNEAYDTLKDPQKKSYYDRFGSTPNANQSGNRSYEYRTDDFPQDIGDVFNQFFGGGSPFGRRQQQPRKNRDIIIEAQIELEDVLKGKELVASYRLTNGREQSVNLSLPKGIANNSTIKFPSLGDDLQKHLPRGDLLVRVKIRPHTKYSRDGVNLHCIERVNVFDLMLGTKHTITTLEGRNLAISIPKGTQPGTVLSISEQGLPTRGGRRGNIYLTIQADIPSVSKTEWVETLTRIRNEIN